MTCFCADEGGAAADTLKVVRRTYMRPECRSAAFRAVKGRILHAADRRGRERPQERDGRRQCRRKPRLRLFGGRTALTEAAFGESPAVRHAPFRADSARLPERRQTGGDSTETGGAFRRLLLHAGKSFVHGRQRQSKAGSKRKKRNCGGRGRRGAGLRQGFFARKNGASLVRMKSFPFAARPASCNLVPGHDSIPCFFLRYALSGTAAGPCLTAGAKKCVRHGVRSLCPAKVRGTRACPRGFVGARRSGIRREERGGEERPTAMAAGKKGRRGAEAFGERAFFFVCRRRGNVSLH